MARYNYTIEAELSSYNSHTLHRILSEHIPPAQLYSDRKKDVGRASALQLLRLNGQKSHVLSTRQNYRVLAADISSYGFASHVPCVENLNAIFFPFR